MSERRKYERFKVCQPITAAVRIGEGSNLYLFSVIDVSEEGMLVAGELEAMDLNDGAQVNISLFSTEPREMFLSCQGVVVDFRGEGKFGFEVPDLSSEERNRLLNICSNQVGVA